MHEMSIAMEVLKIVNQHLPTGQQVKVTKIRLKIGKLTAVIPDNFKFCMEVIARDTPAEGAQIMIDEVPLKVECKDCGKVSELGEPLFLCPACESTSVKILSGRDLFIESIEVEDNESEQVSARDQAGP